MAAPPEKKQKTEGDAENVETAAEKKGPEPPKEHEVDAKPLKGGKVGAVEFLVPDTTVNLITSDVGDLVMPLQANGLQCLFAGGRASVGIKSGRYMFEIHIVERPAYWMHPFLKIGFSIAGSSLLLDSTTGAYFDSAGQFNGARGEKVSDKLFAGDVVACVLNLEKGSPNFNTISLFKNGVRVAQPQALPESLHDKPLFPAVTLKCMTLRTNFGPEPICPLPFKCHMVGSALKTDAEVTTYDATDEGEVLFPVSLPDEGSFDWLDMFLEKNPGYTEISDRAIRDSLENSWGKKRVLPKSSNDKPEMSFGVPELEDGSVKTAFKTLCALQKRKYVVMEVKGNLVREDRAETLKLFKAANFKTSAAVLVGAPSPDFKKRSQMLILKHKQDAADKEHHEKFKAAKAKWLADKKKKEAEKARKKAAKEKEKAAKAVAKAVEEAKKKAAAAKEGKEVEEEEKKEEEEEPEQEEPEEDEPEEPEPVEDDPPKMTLTDEEKQLSFKPVIIPDLTPYVMNTTFTKFSLPEKEEGFDEIQYEFLKDGAKCKKFLKEWVSSRKLTTRVEEIKPSDWFLSRKTAWDKVVRDWHAALARYTSSIAKRRADKHAREARKQLAAVKAAAEKAKAEAEKKNGEDKEEEDKKEEVIEKAKEEDEEEEEEPEPEVDFEGIDVFGVDDITDIGGGMPLYKEFTQDDWTLMSLAFELHLLTYSFKKDCGDEDIPGLHVDHLDFYYQKYFNKGFSPQSFGKETAKDVIELVMDAVLVDSKGMLVNCLQEEMETYQVFVKITEEARRFRTIRADLGEESAVLKFAAQRGNNQHYGQKRKQSWGDWAPQGAQGGKGGKGGGWGQQSWTPPGKKGKKGKGGSK